MMPINMDPTKLAFALALTALVLANGAYGHGGGLHDWNFLPEPSLGKDYIRYEVASCSSWVPIDPEMYVLGPLPVFPPAPADLEVTGRLSLFYYLDGNCNNKATTGFDLDLSLKLNGEPYAERQVNGYGFVGGCSNPTDLYRHNASLGNNRFNIMWWRRENSVTTEDGELYGASVNVMVSRAPPATDYIRSVVLFPSPADSNPVCCELTYKPPPPASFFTSGSDCVPPPPSSPPPPPPSPSPPSPKKSPTKRPPPRNRPSPKSKSTRRLAN